MKLNKVPGAGSYSVGALTRVGSHTILGGKFPTSKKRSFLDAAAERSSSTPASAKYFPQTVDAHVRTPGFKVGTTLSRAEKRKQLPGPNHYSINWTSLNDQAPNYSYGKEKGGKFVDLASKASGKVPGPGAYNSTGMSKVSRGTKWCQIMGIGRSALSGTF